MLFVCMGNICRSPTAEAVFRELVRREAAEHAIEADSAGTHAYHVGSAPDSRTIAAARRRGIDMSELRARIVEAEDFDRFDLLLAMDEQNYRHLLGMAPPGGAIGCGCSWNSRRRRSGAKCPIPITAARPDSRTCSTWSRKPRAACLPS